VWLIAASLFFYGWWNPAYVGLLIGSILVNYSFGSALALEDERKTRTRKKAILILGVAFNLCLLGYFKYANFFLTTINKLAGSEWSMGSIILPLGISFFTFTQIAYLVDAFKGEVKERNLVHYALFVTYFPHLIAGPILHHKEIMPQFSRRSVYNFNYGNIAVGLTVFSLGLFKKVVLADSIAPLAQTVFDAASKGQALTFIEAWSGGISYALQLYFDFSGYSDMAIGLSKLFGVSIPLNFYSPYKAVNIIEFWRRWHISLSRFLMDYLYIPLGGKRLGTVRRYLNVMITMFLGGLWHGAGWTFIAWGFLHGFYLVINQVWHALRRYLGHDLKNSILMGRISARVVTFTAVVIAWVLFRSDTIDSACAVYRGMLGMNGFILPEQWLHYSGMFGIWLSKHGVLFGATPFTKALQAPFLIALLISIAWFFPNTQQFMQKFEPAINIYRGEKYNMKPWIQWSPNWKWAAGCSLAMTAGIIMIDKVSEFLYFQF
jgi:D-alanyl-lipoteichoic acid acyltransferase DltB (MBOAT superfamily)